MSRNIGYDKTITDEMSTKIYPNIARPFSNRRYCGGANDVYVDPSLWQRVQAGICPSKFDVVGQLIFAGMIYYN